MTPREYVREQEAAEKRAQFDRERDMVLAWHTAAFKRVEKMPSLHTVLMRMRMSGGAQTFEQMKANLQMISQLTGIPIRETTH